ncbi:hypothetical protein [Leifsonia aquatica]|uniref:hypothetical protein n=1 Tax=Leifsonia aquatica TaxID=144185 RepID=UPI00046A28BF|nr:hypothetical protein [Leifsonia aquatica]
MLQNREVGGATMGAGQGAAETGRGGTTAAILYGPWGYVNVAAAVVLFAAFLLLVSTGPDDPPDGRWAWTPLLMVVSLSALGALTRRYGAESIRRYARGPRDMRIRTQQIAPFVVVGVLVIGLIGYATGLDGLPGVTIALAIGATAGLAPIFLQKPPASTDRTEYDAVR